MKSAGITHATLVLFVMLAACPGFVQEEALSLPEGRGTGTVEDVRILSRASNALEGGSGGVKGAVIGGILAGGVGAVVGAEAMRDAARIVTTEDATARVVVRCDDGVRYVFVNSDPRLMLLRSGDRVWITNRGCLGDYVVLFAEPDACISCRCHGVGGRPLPTAIASIVPTPR